MLWVMLEKASDEKGKIEDNIRTKRTEIIRKTAVALIWDNAEHFRAVQEDFHYKLELERKVAA